MSGILSALTQVRSNAAPEPRVQLVADTTSSTGSTSRTAGFRINANGNVERRTQTSYSSVYAWLLLGANTEFQVKCSTDGAGAGSAFDTWLDTSASREWYVTDVFGGSEEFAEATFTISIRDKITLAVLDTAAFYAFADKE